MNVWQKYSNAPISKLTQTGQKGCWVHVNALACLWGTAGSQVKPVCLGLIAQIHVDPMTEEQSEGEITEKVRQDGVNICKPSMSHLPEGGPHVALWELPGQYPRCTDWWRTEPLSSKPCKVSIKSTTALHSASLLKSASTFFWIDVDIYKSHILSDVSFLDLQ